MAKRIAAGIVGTLAALIGLTAGAAAIRFMEFRDVAGFLCVTALVAFWLGIRLLRFVWLGKDTSNNSGGRLRRLFLGIGCFFPGFVFSLPLTMIWANLKCPRDVRFGFAAIQVSFYIGILVAIIACVLLLQKGHMGGRTS